MIGVYPCPGASTGFCICPRNQNDAIAADWDGAIGGPGEDGHPDGPRNCARNPVDNAAGNGAIRSRTRLHHCASRIDELIPVCA